MADDMLNEGSEEEKKSSDDSFSDDDFGLPDLEFDDLEELDMSGDSDDESSADDGSEVVDEPTPEAPETVEFDMSLVEDAPDPISDLGAGLQEGDLDPPETTALNEGMDELEDVLDSAQLISDRLGDEEESPSDELSIEESEPSLPDALDFGSDTEDVSSGGLFEAESEEEEPKEDLFAGIDSPDDLAALGMADEEEVPGAESDDGGGSLFAADSEDEEESIFGSGGGLAMDDDEKDEFEPAGDSELPPNYKAYSYEESSGGFTKIVIIGLVLILAVAAGLLWMNSKDDGEKKVVAKKETKAPVKKAPAKKSPKTETEATEKAAKNNAAAAAKTPAKKAPTNNTTTSRPKASQAPVATATPGEIVSVSDRTQRSYVIVGSFIDEDLAMDYALKLSGEGNGVKIIQPYGKSKRYRVSVADYSTYGDAASQLDSFKEEFGDQIWALKY